MSLGGELHKIKNTEINYREDGLYHVVTQKWDDNLGGDSHNRANQLYYRRRAVIELLGSLLIDNFGYKERALLNSTPFININCSLSCA